MTVQDLVPSLSLENLVQQRDAMVERIREAHRLVGEAEQLALSMFGEDAMMGHGLDLMTTGSRKPFTPEVMTKEVDGRAWSYLLQKSGMQTFLDAAAREKWEAAIQKNDVPELTLANIEATFGALYENRGEMFERGVLELFRRLSWQYKTNSPVKFGRRLVLRYMVDGYGFGHVSFDGANRLDDLIRVMSVLDGKPEPDHREGAYHLLGAAKWPGSGVHALRGYVSLRGFKNRNCHLTFLRPDLVDRMNLILAKHFPNALPPAQGDA